MKIDIICERFSPTPYQMWVLSRNGYKYKIDRIRKIGNLIYAPYRCNLARGFRDYIRKLLLGPRADLIGPDSMIASDERGIDPWKTINL